MQKATEEYKYEGFCDTELTTNKQTRDLKTKESDELTAELEKLVADIQQLPSDIAALGEKIAAPDAVKVKATAIKEVKEEVYSACTN